MGGSQLKPLIYTEHIGTMLRKETVDQLDKLSIEKGYDHPNNVFGKTLKQPKRGRSRLIREIVEDYLHYQEKKK